MASKGRPKQETTKKKYMITLDRETKEQAMEILKGQGFTLSGAVEMFLRTVINEKGFHVNFGTADTTQNRIEYAYLNLNDDKETTDVQEHSGDK